MSGSDMSSPRLVLALVALGVLLLLGGVAWLVGGGHHGRGGAVLTVGLGFVLVCASQAVRMLGRR